MTTTFTLLDAWGYSLAHYLLAVLWQSTILFAAAGILLWALRRRHAAVRHAICVTAALLAPFLPLLSTLAARAGTPQAPVAVLPAYQQPAGNLFSLPAPAPLLAPRTGQTRPTDPTGQTGPTPPVLDFSSLRPRDYPWAILLLAYLAGLLLFLGLFAAGHVRIHAWTRRSTPMNSPGILHAFHDAAKTLRLTRPPHVRNAPALHAPISVGLIRRIVLFPESVAAHMTDAELRAVAIHETAHLKRRDPLILSLIALVRALLFFHPLVWLAARQITTLAEQAADDAVLDATGQPLEYAKLLTRLAEGLPRRTPSPEFAAGIVLSQNVFLRRVEAILSHQRAQLRRLTRWA
ncbi:MAG: M56 family metallopeptidase, partial [Candidatus Hydrogenedentes bacterium]|nr:M56 family metallopeptidase [Candidatus Hydrogenedentota bacterium]